MDVERSRPSYPMRVIVINTGTELLLGDVLNTHLSFIAREIFPLGLAGRATARGAGWTRHSRCVAGKLSRSADIIFVTGGLGPTTDDVTREITAELLGLELVHDPELAHTITSATAPAGNSNDRSNSAPGRGAARRGGLA